eukprot:CAMPEP_0182469320 /NCGR_PEP_ID=MMETSP1319-20130603/16920_1 /TAXON_ID=172717 /ORGANISM="Bolidomonas pacifica, Strain RCC208" /LENGTH=45 /DNA_ID= /DNA_START= /DNA_END= /DNA_ORIENTATION=
MANVLGDDKVAEIKQSVTEQGRRISHHRRKSRITNGGGGSGGVQE